MINKDKIILNTQTYYTCSWSGVTAVKILKVFEDGCALVQAGKKPFIRPIQHIYNEYEHARIGKRDWEHDERKRKRNNKKVKKSEKQTEKKAN